MDRDHVFWSVQKSLLRFDLHMEAFGTVPKPIVKVFVCSFHFRCHFVLKSRMKTNSQRFSGPCENKKSKSTWLKFESAGAD